MRISAIAILIGSFVLGGCVTNSAKDGGTTNPSVEAKLHAQLTGYKFKWPGQSMAACIDWSSSTPDWANARYRSIYRTSSGSEKKIPATRLMHFALKKCDRVKSTLRLVCECYPVDENGTSVLNIPSEVYEEGRVKVATVDSLQGKWSGVYETSTEVGINGAECGNGEGSMEIVGSSLNGMATSDFGEVFDVAGIVSESGAIRGNFLIEGQVVGGMWGNISEDGLAGEFEDAEKCRGIWMASKE